MAGVIPSISIGHAGIDWTLQKLQRRGVLNVEGVILWLGKRSPQLVEVAEAYEPIYNSAADSFVIPPHGMSALMSRIAASGLAVVAQVHTHPGAAFHSAADERWALIRHAGAYSIVLPKFAHWTSETSFWSDAAVFVMQPHGKWLELSGLEVSAKCKTS